MKFIIAILVLLFGVVQAHPACDSVGNYTISMTLPDGYNLTDTNISTYEALDGRKSTTYKVSYLNPTPINQYGANDWVNADVTVSDMPVGSDYLDNWTKSYKRMDANIKSTGIYVTRKIDGHLAHVCEDQDTIDSSSFHAVYLLDTTHVVNIEIVGKLDLANMVFDSFHIDKKR